MRKRSVIIIGVLSVLLLVCVCINCSRGDVYNSAKSWLQSEAKHGNYTRGIGTNKDLWLNGYLGPFLRFKMFGSLNWLAFPLLIYFLVTIRKRERWEIALALVLTLSCIFICMRGYMNYRYQLTLFPALITMIFLFGWQILRYRNWKVVSVVAVVCSCLLSANSYSLRETYTYYWKGSIGCGLPGELFPYKLIEYINENVRDDSVILERNQPILYYHTNKKNLRNQGKNRYILVRCDTVPGYDLVCEDQGYRLYKAEEEKENLTVKDFNQRVPDFGTNFSNWVGRDEASISNMDKAIAPMVVQGHQGEFTFKRISSGDGNMLRVLLKRPMFKKRSEIQFGYCFKTNGLKLKVKDGDVVSIITRVRLSKRAKRSAELFVQDRTNYWSREKVCWRGSSWHDVLVSKRVRNKFTNICMGIYWEPGSTDEWLDVKLVRIFVSDKNS